MQSYEWELLKISHHLGKSCRHRHYDKGDIMFLICHVVSNEHMLKGLHEFLCGGPSQRVTTFPFLIATGLVQVEI